MIPISKFADSHHQRDRDTGVVTPDDHESEFAPRFPWTMRRNLWTARSARISGFYELEASRVSRFWRFSQCHAQPLELKCEAEQRKQRNYQHDSTTCHQQDIDTRTKLRHMPKNYDRE